MGVADFRWKIVVPGKDTADTLRTFGVTSELENRALPRAPDSLCVTAYQRLKHEF